jgi:predicted kinase
VAGRLHAVHLSIDPVEDAMLAAGFPSGWATGVAAYEVVRAMAETNLTLGHSVVVDAVNDSVPVRQTWLTAAQRTGATLRFVVLSVTDETEHRRRLEGRSRGLAHLPEPTWEEVRALTDAFAPWSGEHETVSADPPVSEVVRSVLARLAT